MIGRYLVVKKTVTSIMTPTSRTLAVIVLFLVLLLECILLVMYGISVNPEEELKAWPATMSRNISLYLNPDIPPKLLPDTFCQRAFLTVMVNSAVRNIGSRTAIRSSWGHKLEQEMWNFSVYFIVGLPTRDSEQFYLTKENEIHGDIIQENFIDTYFNLTLKSIAMLKHFSSCPSFLFLLKADDDTFMNVPLLVRTLREKVRGDERLLLGAKERLPLRNVSPKSKWYAPSYMYKETHYPDFLLGSMGYVMSRNVAEKLYQAAMALDYFHLEDVFITGMCSQKANIIPRGSGSFKPRNKIPRNLCDLFNIYSVHQLNPKELVIAKRVMEMIQFSCTILDRVNTEVIL